MKNVHTLKNISSGHRLGSAREMELEEMLRNSIKSVFELTNEYRDLQDVYSKREEAFQRIHTDVGNKISQLNASSTELRSKFISERKSRIELEAKYSAKIKSLKSSIKTLKRELTLAQKALSSDKATILSLEAKVRELEGRLEDIDLERTYHDLDVMGGVIEEQSK